MAIVQAPPLRVEPPHSSRRDRGIDLVRAACVVGVVLLHAIMVGVTVEPSGPVFANAAEGAAWFAPLTWFAQIMPIFFVVGGFAGALAFRRGGTATGFVRGRVHRLLWPAALSIAAVGAGLVALTLAGVPGDVVQIAGFRYSQPLWFLGVFLLCQALLPMLLAAHDRAPARTIVLLAAAAVTVDVVRAATGIDAVGFLNLAFVWLTLQQVGFFFADGRVDRLPRSIRILLALAAVAALATTFATGIFSHDLIANLNPPTTALLLVGVVQTAVLSLLRRRLAAVAQRPRVAAFTDFVTARTMTIYLWHMPVLLTMAGVVALFALATGSALPEPSSLEWWLTRPVWLAVALVATALVARVLAAGERRRMPVDPATTARTVQAVVLGLCAVVLLLAVGTNVVTAAVAVGLMAWALRRISHAARTGRATRQRNSIVRDSDVRPPTSIC